MRIWTNIFPWCTVLFAGGWESCWGLVSHCSSLLSRTLCTSPPAVSEGPRFPFQCSPRDPHSTVQSTVCGTRSLALPIKDSGKKPQQNNRLKPWDEYFIVCTWLGVQTAAQTSKTLAQKVLSLSWGFFCLPVLLFFFHPLSVWHNVQKCWAVYIPPLPNHVQKIYFFILVKIRLFYLFDWPSMNEDFSKKKKKRKVIISQSSPLVFSTEAVVTVNALKSSHVFPKTALEKDSDYTCAAVKGFLTPAVRRAHYFERLLTFSQSRSRWMRHRYPRHVFPFVSFSTYCMKKYVSLNWEPKKKKNKKLPSTWLHTVYIFKTIMMNCVQGKQARQKALSSIGLNHIFTSHM